MKKRSLPFELGRKEKGRTGNIGFKEDGTHETGEFTWTPPDEEETVYKDDPKVVAPYQRKRAQNNRKRNVSYVSCEAICRDHRLCCFARDGTRSVCAESRNA
ncbi:hypothetical protein PO124_23050 [Bacillus licheniformis]|nr:hypothetical protein [Bacillus licheniformis]